MGPLLPVAASIFLPLCGSCQDMGAAAADVPIPVDGDEYADSDPSALVDFRAPLEGHGAWVDDPTYGTTWVPEAGEVGPDFSPYVSSGHWAYQDDLVWVSDYEWGWVPFHYGRWVAVPGVGWAWVPGRVYAGAWVDWRTGDAAYAYVGWSPTPPELVWRAGVAVALGLASPALPVTYVATGDLFAPQVAARVAPPATVAVVSGHTTPYVPAAPAVGRAVAHPVPRAPAPVALGIDPAKVAALPPGRATLRAQLLAVPSSAVRLGARPPVAHVLRVDPASVLVANARARAVRLAPSAPAPAPLAPRLPRVVPPARSRR